MADIFSVIADPTRRHLLEILLERYSADSGAAAGSAGGSAAGTSVGAVGGEASVGELVKALDLSQPTVSKHLKVLRDAELVEVREEGQHRYYKLNAEPLEDVEDWLIPFLSADFDESEEESDEWSENALPEAVTEFGKSVGRTVAGTSHQARELVEDAKEFVSRLRK